MCPGHMDPVACGVSRGFIGGHDYNSDMGYYSDAGTVKARRCMGDAARVMMSQVSQAGHMQLLGQVVDACKEFLLPDLR